MNHLKLLNDFANSKAKDFNIKIDIQKTTTSFKPIEGHASYKDAMAISSIVCGAHCFTYWLDQNGYKICKKSCKG